MGDEKWERLSENIRKTVVDGRSSYINIDQDFATLKSAN